MATSDEPEMATDVPSEEEVERLRERYREWGLKQGMSSDAVEAAGLLTDMWLAAYQLRAALTRAVSEIEAAPHGNFCLASRCWYRWPKTGRFCGRCESAHDRLLHDWQPEACNCWKSRAFKELRRG